MSKTIMLIHGAWLNARSWEGFKARYEAQGYAVIAPSWPLDERPPAELRASPAPALAKIGINEVIDHYDRLIRALPEPPILIGHSFGGTITQHLLDRGLGAAGVVIDPAPTSGVLVGWQTIKSTFPVFFAWGSWRRVMTMSRGFFATRFAQTVPPEQADAMYERYIVPTPGKVYWDGLVSAAGKIRWDNPDRAPLLLIGGGIDLIAEARMTQALFEKQKLAPSQTELRIYPRRSHWTCLGKAGRRSRTSRSTGLCGTPALPTPRARAGVCVRRRRCPARSSTTTWSIRFSAAIGCIVGRASPGRSASVRSQGRWQRSTLSARDGAARRSP